MSSMNSIFGKAKEVDDGEHWLTVSDLMAGLMMVFLFIAIVFMRNISIERDKIKDVAETQYISTNKGTKRMKVNG